VPLVLRWQDYAPETLREIERGLRADLEETAGALESPTAPVRDGGSLEQALDLARSMAAVGRTTDAPDASPERVAAVLNAEYAGLVAAIGLMKRGLDVPQVPARRR
jgi:hypothetical protein